MILAANESYWKCWERNIQDILNLINDAKNELKIEVCLFKTKDINFEEQKGGRNNYKPSMPKNNTWEQIE